MIIKFIVNGQKLSLHPSFQKIKPVADSKNFLIANFDFHSKEWREQIVYALFTHNKQTYKMVLGADPNLNFNECVIPFEVLRCPNFTVALYCGDRITTNIVTIPLEASGYTEEIVNQSTAPTVAEQLDSLMKQYCLVCNSILQDCERIRQELKGGEN